MSRSARLPIPLLVLSLLLPVAGSTVAIGQDTAMAERRNIRLTFRVIPIDGGKRGPAKSYDLLVVDGGRGATLLSGSRVPIPHASLDSGEAATADRPARTEFVYQNVGFTSQAEARILPDGRIHLISTLEDSSVVAGKDDGPPTVETRQLSFDVILTEGVPLEVTRIDGIREDSGLVEIEADILP